MIQSNRASKVSQGTLTEPKLHTTSVTEAEFEAMTEDEKELFWWACDQGSRVNDAINDLYFAAGVVLPPHPFNVAMSKALRGES